MLTIIITKVQENKEKNDEQSTTKNKQYTILISEEACQFDSYESPLLGKKLFKWNDSILGLNNEHNQLACQNKAAVGLHLAHCWHLNNVKTEM